MSMVSSMENSILLCDNRLHCWR